MNFFKCILFFYFYLMVQLVSSQSCIDSLYTKSLFNIKLLANQKKLQEGLKITDSLIQKFRINRDTSCYSFYKLKDLKGLMYLRKAEFGQALIEFSELINELEKTPHKELLAQAYLSIALVHEVLGRQTACKTNLDHALNIITRYDLKEPLTRYYVRKASYERIFFRNKSECLLNAQEALKYKEYSNDLNDIADAYMLNSACTLNTNTKNEYRQKAISAYFDAKDFIASFYLAAAEHRYLLEEGKDEVADKYIDAAKEKFLDAITEGSLEKSDGLSIYYYIKMNHSKKIGNNKEALYYSELYNKTNEEAIRLKNQSQINKMQDEFLYEKEQRKVQALGEKNKMLFNYLIAAIIGLVALLLLAYLIHKNRRELKLQKDTIEKINKELTNLNEKNGLLLSEVHHRVKNSLQNVISMLELKKATITDVTMQDNLGTIANRVKCIGLIHEQLYQNQEFENINVYDYILKISNLYRQIADNQSSIVFNLNMDKNLFLNFDTMMPIGIIVNELITNSIKHSKHEHNLLISITLSSVTQDEFQFEYKDNGIKSNVAKKEGMGTILIKSMVRQLNSQIKNQDSYDLSFLFREKVTAVV